MHKSSLPPSVILLLLALVLAIGQNDALAANELPSEFSPDSSKAFNQVKWCKLTDQGVEAIEQKRFKSAESYFKAAVREASKSPCMSTYMVDSLVHYADLFRVQDRKAEAKACYDEALEMVKVLVPDICPYCESNAQSVPMIYGPHSDELEAWAKAQAAQLGDFKAVTQKQRKKRPSWYCKQCQVGY